METALEIIIFICVLFNWVILLAVNADKNRFMQERNELERENFELTTRLNQITISLRRK